MIVLLNPSAGGGTALKKWARIEPEMRRRWGSFEVQCLDRFTPPGALVSALVDAGERQFVAAGGDGTLNAVVHAIMSALPEERQASVAIGAVGLGSSNDFHKPMVPGCAIAGIPCAVNFASAARRDVGVITLRCEAGEDRRHFLVNASVGITAEANRLFNTPEGILCRLKGHWTRGAILYAAARAMMGFADIRVMLRLDAEGRRSVRLTNLAVLKSPYVGGNLKYPDGPRYDSGRFAVTLLHGAGRFGRLTFFRALSHGRLSCADRVASWMASSVALQADAPFPVEFDGEVVLVVAATFSLLPRHLKVCPC